MVSAQGILMGLPLSKLTVIGLAVAEAAAMALTERNLRLFILSEYPFRRFL
jgi:hypothetical protein